MLRRHSYIFSKTKETIQQGKKKCQIRDDAGNGAGKRRSCGFNSTDDVLYLSEAICVYLAIIIYSFLFVNKNRKIFTDYSHLLKKLHICKMYLE